MATKAVTMLCALVIGLLTVPLAGSSFAGSDAPRTLSWNDLLPPGEIEILEKMLEDLPPVPAWGHSPGLEGGAPLEQIGTFNTVKSLNGALVRIPGFVVPTDITEKGEVKSFLLVPYYGACIHTPPPPPNQIVYIEAATPFRLFNIQDPIWVVGTMKTEPTINGLGNTAYSMTLNKWTPYED